MKKASFISGTLPPITGGEFYNYQLYSHLTTEGIYVDYINLHKIRLLFKLNIIPVFGDVLVNLLVFILIFRKLNFLVIQDQYFGPYLILTNFIQKFIRKGRNVLIVHHFDKYDSQKYGALPRHILNYPLDVIREISSVFFAEKIITNSHFNKQEIESIRTLEEGLISILPPGLDRNRFVKVEHQPRPVDNQFNGSKVILCIGHCIPRKGIIYLIEAFAKVDHCGFELCIVGKLDKDVDYHKKVESLIFNLNLTKVVHLLNRVDQDALASLYSQADFFVLPSLKEGFGIVLLEAMHYGLPIITTNVSAMPELVEDGKNGFLVNPSDSDDLAIALSKLIHDSTLRQQMSECSLKRIEEGYHWEQVNSEFLSIVQEALAEA